MGYSGFGFWGKLATRVATIGIPPYYERCRLSAFHPNGYISFRATIHHQELHLNKRVFIDDHVFVYQDRAGGPVTLGEQVLIFRGSIIQTGQGGSVTIGARTSLQPRCQLSAYKSAITIGSDVQIAPNCAFYPYDHGIKKGELMRIQPLQSKGGIEIGDDAWLGVGVTVLDGVKIGKGAVIGAGSVVKEDIPDYAIATGAPSKVVKMRI